MQMIHGLQTMEFREYNELIEKVRDKGRKDFAMELEEVIKRYSHPLSLWDTDSSLDDLCDKIRKEKTI